jgi:hypothetical protein
MARYTDAKHAKAAVDGDKLEWPLEILGREEEERNKDDPENDESNRLICRGGIRRVNVLGILANEGQIAVMQTL